MYCIQKLIKKKIIKNIKKMMSKQFLKKINKLKLFYGNGNSYQKAYKIILKHISKIQINKKFYDI